MLGAAGTALDETLVFPVVTAAAVLGTLLEAFKTGFATAVCADGRGSGAGFGNKSLSFAGMNVGSSIRPH